MSIKNLSLLILSIATGSSFAATTTSTSSFQQFDNQYNLGYQLMGGNLSNNSACCTFTAQSVNLEVERLFDVGVWIDGNFGMLTAYQQPDLGTLNGGALGQYPYFNTLNGKVGYAFNLVNNHLQLIPYGLIGRNANFTTATALSNSYSNLSQDYFYTSGVGARLSYRINSAIMLYADQLFAYNYDDSGPDGSVQNTGFGTTFNANNFQSTSTIGARFNVAKNLQLGINGFWNGYKYQSSMPNTVYVPVSTYGTELSIGLTY